MLQPLARNNHRESKKSQPPSHQPLQRRHLLRRIRQSHYCLAQPAKALRRFRNRQVLPACTSPRLLKHNVATMHVRSSMAMIYGAMPSVKLVKVEAHKRKRNSRRPGILTIFSHGCKRSIGERRTSPSFRRASAGSSQCSADSTSPWTFSSQYPASNHVHLRRWPSFGW